ncbi:hypothetical protein ATCVBr0604L_327L [Acanthocystis turfacea Chlorella virus Br0604L]|nr:hypothetical protein ATCVBr0604L_327L [Acanthocystis turfacea Chlorella virus Br0604L]
MKNNDQCDKIVTENPDKEFRVKLCQSQLRKTSQQTPYRQRWCAMYKYPSYLGGPTSIMFPEYASCIKNPGGYVDMTQEKCANACKGSPYQAPCKVPQPVEITFNKTCGPFPYTNYAANLATCDAIVTANPAKYLRTNMCAATLAKPTVSNPARWCSMYKGNNQVTGTVFPEYAQCIKTNGMVDMTKVRCANACKGKPGQNGCPGQKPLSN